jgi:DnaJ family protein C protein 1
VFSRCVSSLLPYLGAKLISRWSKEDHEVFDLVSALEQAEGKSLPLPGLAGLAPTDDLGKGVDFYSHLGIDSSATLNQLNKAYRKKSLELQYVQLTPPIQAMDS